MNRKPILLILLVLLLAACGSFEFDKAALEESIFGEPVSNQVAVHDEAAHDHAADDDPAAHDHATHDHEQVAAEPVVVETAVLQVVLVPSQLVVGQNRMAVGLLNSNKQMIHEADVQFQYYDLSNPAEPQLEQAVTAYPVQSPDGLTTLFAHDRRFSRAGEWGLAVEASLADGKTAVQRIKFNVDEVGTAVLPGEMSPHIQTPTLAGVNGDFSLITSAWEPNAAFYQLSLDEALGNGQPTVLLLATPAFCQTRFCGPSYDIATALEAEYGESVNFIHVEVYSGLPDPSANNWELSPVMGAFGLATEPWVYVMDAAGEVVYRAEGLFTQAEIAAHLR